MGYPIREANLVGAGLTGVANGSAVSIADLDEAYVTVSNVFVGTWKVQVSFDGGTNWVDFDTGTAPKLTAVLPPCRFIRAICTAFTSGTISASVSGRNKAPGIA